MGFLTNEFLSKTIIYTKLFLSPSHTIAKGLVRQYLDVKLLTLRVVNQYTSSAERLYLLIVIISIIVVHGNCQDVSHCL